MRLESGKTLMGGYTNTPQTSEADRRKLATVLELQ